MRVGDSFFVLVAIEGMGFVVLAFDAADEMASYDALVRAVEERSLVRVRDLIRTQVAQTPDGAFVRSAVDSQSVDMAEPGGRLVNMGLCSMIVDRLDDVGQEFIKTAVVDVLEKRRLARSGLVVPKSGHVPDPASAQKMMQQSAQITRDLRDGRKGLVIRDGGRK